MIQQRGIQYLGKVRMCIKCTHVFGNVLATLAREV